MPRGSKGRSRGSRKSWMDFSSVSAFLSNVATSTSSIFSVSESQNEYMNNGYNDEDKAQINATQINRQALPRPRIRLRNESPKGTPGLKSEQNDDLISASGSSRKLVEFSDDSGSDRSSFFSPRHSSQQRLVSGKFASSTNSTASSSGDLDDAGCSFGGDESEVTRLRSNRFSDGDESEVTHLRSNRAGTPVEVNTIDWITSKFSFRPETGSNPRPHSPNVDPNSVDAHPEVTQMIEIQRVALVEDADEIIAAQEFVALKEEEIDMLLAEQQHINEQLGDCERQEKKLAKKAEVAEGFYLQMKERAKKEKYKIKELLANNTKEKALRDAAEARKVIEVAEKVIEKLGRDKLKLQNERLKRGATETETKTKTKMSSPQKSILRGSSNNQTKPNKKPIATVTKPIATKPTKPQAKPQAKPKKRGAKATPPRPTGKEHGVNIINLKITPKKRRSSTMASTSEC